jgi:Trypsin-like peptidase domain
MPPMLPLKEFAQRRCVEIRRACSNGSGFYISPSLIVTCSHVIGRDKASGDTISVIAHDNTIRVARVIANVYCDDMDFALLRDTAGASNFWPVLVNEIPSNDLWISGYPIYDNHPRFEIASGDLAGVVASRAATNHFYTLSQINVRPGSRVSETSGRSLRNWAYARSATKPGVIFDAYADAGGNFIDTAGVYKFRLDAALCRCIDQVVVFRR